VKKLLCLLCLSATQAQAYVGSFDPQPLRFEAEITFYDDQFPGIRCASLAETALDVAMIPLTLQAAGCASFAKGIVIVSITIGLGSLYGFQVGATPNGNLGHETRHIFDGNFHPTLLSFIERVRRPDQAAGGVVSGTQHD
jgi:hypothetical protein